MKNLVNQEKLLLSDVAANNRMNRGRGCLGENSYQKDLAFDPVEFLYKRWAAKKSVAWLDIACGEGRALIEAATIFSDLYAAEKNAGDLRIIGIDLAGMFSQFARDLKFLELIEMPVEDFEPAEKFDLITCVHALHYIGDKLAVIRRAAGWLKKDGVFRANLELRNLKLTGKRQSGRTFSKFLREKNFVVDSRKHLIGLAGGQRFDVPFEYLGADDEAGPNSTGQPAVDSYYKL